MPDGILSGPIDLDGRRRPPDVLPVRCAPGLVVQHRASGTTGAVVDWRPSRIVLLDRSGRRHQFRNERGAFAVDGRPATLVAPERPRIARPVTRSGSLAPLTPTPPRTARGARLWVEGIHDAELVEQVWGDDLRVEGVVVEPMHGMDHLPEAIARFDPGPDRRLGVLLDHLVPGSKEQRTAARLSRWADLLVTGHPFVDVWAAVRPSLIGAEAWPQVPKGRPWKAEVARALGYEPERLWPTLRARIASYADLHPALVGAVEQLIDFVTEPPPAPEGWADAEAGGSVGAAAR